MQKKILIVITGSIAAYKTLYLIRKLKEKGFFINVIMTNSAKKFITPLSVSSLSENKVCENLFDLTEETEMGHELRCRLSNEIVDLYCYYGNQYKDKSLVAEDEDMKEMYDKKHTSALKIQIQLKDFQLLLAKGDLIH